jgi:chemotaxis protein MotA
MSTPVGILLAFGAIVGSMIMEGGKPAALITHPAPLVLVIFGTLGATMAGVQMKDVGASFKAAMKAMKGNKTDVTATVEELVGFADTARREGLLALEEKVKAVEDPFLRRGLELVIDGSDPEAVEDTLHAELGSIRERHKVQQKFWADMGGFSPTLGIIGTVLSLLHVLENLDKPEHLGPLIGAAFLATLWGVMLANVVYLPLGNKLKRASGEEIAYKELVLQGVLSIQAGASPRSVGERLKSYLAPQLRDAEAGGGKGGKGKGDAAPKKKSA